MKIGEIKEFNINEKYIRVEYVGEDLYVINNVLVCVDLNEGYNLFNPKHLIALTELKDHPYFPYSGPENNSVIGISVSAVDDNEFITSYWDLTTFKENVQKRATDSLRHYRQNLNRM